MKHWMALGNEFANANKTNTARKEVGSKLVVPALVSSAAPSKKGLVRC